MNKGLEVIEAHHLFGVARRPHRGAGAPAEPGAFAGRIRRRLHARPAWACRTCAPRWRWASAGPSASPRASAGLDLLAHGRLDFEPPDLAAFPCLRLAFEALAAGGTAPAVLNAANEVAVSAFLQRRIGFLAIPALVEDTLAALPAAPAASLAALREADAQARRHAEAAIAQLATCRAKRMSEFFGSVWWLIVSLGVLVTFHEFGHYWVARRCGVKVLRFSVGFGKAAVVASRQGRHRVRDRRDPARRLRQDARRARRRGRLRPTVAQAFNRQSVWKRIAIVARRPARQPDAVRGAVLGDVRDRPPGLRAGGRPGRRHRRRGRTAASGDTVLAVGDRATPTWSEAQLALIPRRARPRDIARATCARAHGDEVPAHAAPVAAARRFRRAPRRARSSA